MAKYWQSEIIPSHWGITTLINVCEKITDGSHFSPEIQSTGRKYITVSNLYGDKVHVEEAECISETDFEQLVQNGCQPQTGDVLLSKDGTVGRTAIVEDNDFVVLSSLGILRPKNMLISRFLKYSLDSDVMQEQMRSMMAGAALKRITLKKIQSLQLAIPPINEQKNIANYLDDRCSKVDAVIAEAKASIEEYKELKQAVIYEAVTKGLDKNVEMKDSGVEWLDDIPANWHLVKITRILDKNHPYAIGDGDHGSIKTDQYLDCGIPFIRVQNLGWGTKLNLENVVYISEEDNRQIQNSTLKPDDILFAKTGATIGKTAIIPKDVPVANTTSHVGKITISKEHNPRYVFYVLSSQVGYRQFWDIALQKTTRPELSIEETKSIKVILPNDRELEDKIVKFLDEKIPVFDELINTKQSLIEDLESYKKSLIYEVVTGKRKVVA